MAVLKRCDWVSGVIHTKYHDTEWGVPLHNDRKLFEFLVLDSMQSGLSWQMILRKRKSFRKAFDNFDPRKMWPILLCLAEWERREI